jgi:uncharacterized protein
LGLRLLYPEGDPVDEEPTLLCKLLHQLAEFGATKELAGVLPCERLSRGIQSFQLEGGISYDLTLTNTGGGVLLTGHARAKGLTECTRCLEDATFEVDGEVEGYFILNPDQQDVELSDEEFTAVGVDGMVDLAVFIRAAVILELPLILLCKEDCAGLCPTCGANLNENPCACHPSVIA